MIQNGSMSEFLSLANDMLIFAKTMAGMMCQWIWVYIEAICKMVMALFGV
ncbi:MAG: hypothetical protein IJ419_08210 [Agathobacter sp.]|nr:hypothetical protein [Agathobacter sp.]